MSPGPAQPPHDLRWRLVRWLRERDRRAGKHERTRRLRELLDAGGNRDWGHRLMTLVGRNDCGNWGPPRGRDLYIRDEWVYPPGLAGSATSKAQMEHRRQVTHHAMTAWDGVKRGETWRTFDWQDDGHTLRVGFLGSDGRLHDSGIDGREELRLFRRWLLWDSWVKAEWLGLRRWLYYRGLSHAVDHRERLSCGLTPPEGSNGYSHWHCTLRRPLWAILTGRRTQHPGPHRFLNYTWTEGEEQVRYAPLDDSSGWRARV